MKKNYLKLVLISLGAMVIASSCLKTEELDSVKQMREAKVGLMKVDSMQKYANYLSTLTTINTTKISNSYDSVNNIYELQKAKAAAELAILNSQNSTAKAKLQWKVDSLGVEKDRQVALTAIQQQVIDAQKALSSARNSLLIQQKTEIDNQKLYDNAKDDNVAKQNAYNDYNIYYNGGGTLSDLTTITDGIYSLRSKVMGWQNEILTQTSNKQNKIETNANDILNFRNTIRNDSLDIENQKRVLTIGTDAQNTQDYTTAYNNMVALFNAASTDLELKKAVANDALNKRDTAAQISTIATDAYNTNLAAKLLASGDMNTALGAFTSRDQLIADQALKTSNLDADTKEFNAWTAKYTTVNASLKDSAAAKNTAQVNYDEALAIFNAAVAAGSDTTNLRKNRDNTLKALNTANGKYTTILAKYNSILGSYNTAKTNMENSKTALTTANEKIKSYDDAKIKYDATVSKDAALYATKMAKIDQLATLNSNLTAAQTAETNAQNYYTQVSTSKTTLKGVIDGIYNANVAIQTTIATANKTIAEKQNDIADLRLQIARVGSTDFSYDTEIAIRNEKIAVANDLITRYTAKATALKASL